MTTEAVVEAVARAICVACEDDPDHQGDARGNEFRWQDYRDAALAAISAFTADTLGEVVANKMAYDMFGQEDEDD